MNKRKAQRIERRKKDKEWAKQIKERDKGCVICGSKVRLNAHHIIPREIKEFRYDLMNGLALCPRHHKYNFQISAHRSSFSFLEWFINNRPEQYLYLKKKLKTYLENFNKGDKSE